MKIKKYHCSECMFFSDKLYLFKKHLKTASHIKKSKTLIENIKDFEKFKKDVFCCGTCNKPYTSNQNLQKHMKLCESDIDMQKLTKENKKLHKQIQIKDQQLYEQLKTKDAQLSDALKIAKNNSQSIETTINILKYAKLNLNNAEPLKELNSNDVLNVIKYKNPKGTETKNETYVKTAIHKFNHGIFANFIGDMIISHYKPKTKKDANVIATDTSRLCFIIMQKVKKDKIEQKEWINDKSGKKFTELILKPIINAVKETLIEFIEFKKTKELNENSLCLMGKCVELKRDIEVEKFTKPILRYVAPSFHFDTLKLLDEDSDNESVSEDEQPIKIIAKKN